MADIPNFGELLAPQIRAVPQAALPGFLARLERGAAQRYREWAEHYDGGPRAVLLACAGREDEIADRVDRLFPLAPGDLPAVEAALPGALETYLGVFRGLSVADQLRIQAGAELQGAQAWRGMASGHDDAAVRDALLGCSALEEESSAAVLRLLEQTPQVRHPVRRTPR